MEEQEMQRCAADFNYFCETYVKIRTPNRGVIPFALYDFQKRYAKTLQENRFVIAKKFRQGGFTTTTEIFLLWKCMFQNDQHVMFTSKTDREAVYASGVVKHLLPELPEWLRPKLSRINDHLIEFAETKSKMFFGTAEAACGRSLSHIVFDEAAYWKYAEKWWKCMFPCISVGGSACILSTPNGNKNWFYEVYTDAMNEHNSFHAFKADYWEHPDYNDPEWVKRTRENLGEKGWRQEVLCEFIDS